MGITERLFGGGARHQPPSGDVAVRKAALQLAQAAMSSVQEDSGAVRVEDYIAVLAALTGEAALVSAEVLDIETTTILPGSAVFGDQINVILTGDQADYASLPVDNVVGILFRELVPGTAAREMFQPLDQVYRHVAANVGKAPWGNVTTTVALEHRPRVSPLRAAFELRGAVAAAQASAGLPRTRRYVVCALALADGLKQVKTACDMSMAVTLSMEVVFGMAKMAPMSRTALQKVRQA